MSTATTAVGVVGTTRDRVDGRLKVTGAATYPIDATLSGLAHAVSGAKHGDEWANSSHIDRAGNRPMRRLG